jgi:tetratricopeptide (TPR) repeat protein
MSAQLDFLLQQALSYLHNNNYASANLLLKQIVRTNPKHSEALRLMAVIATKQGNHQLALEIIDRSIAADKKNGIAYSNKGNILSSLGEFQEAIKLYELAIKYCPSYAEAHSNLGNTFQSISDVDSAIVCYKKAIQLDSNNATFFSNLGNAYLKLELYEAAYSAFSSGFNLDPDNIDLLLGKGRSQIELEEFEGAINSLNRILSINSSHAGALSNLGVIHFKHQRYEEALSFYDKALASDPELADAWSNKGAVLERLRLHDQAAFAYESAINRNPNLANSHLNLACLNLYRFQFLDGWKGYEWRWKVGTKDLLPLNSTKPLWKGDSFKGRLFIWAEQGVGDQVLFSSMLDNLAKYSQEKIISVQPKLLPIFRRTFPNYQFIERGEHLPDDEYDCHIPIGSLGQFFRNTIDDFQRSKNPYLLVDETLTSTFQSLNQFQNKPTCGLSWKSSNKSIGESKSLSLMNLLPILEGSHLEFINLQYGDTLLERDFIKNEFKIDIHEINNLNLFEDVESLLSLIQACDIVLTSSNLTAHLAGAIGKETLLLSPYSWGKHWYWHDNQGVNLWYPSVRVFKQQKAGDWTDPVNEAKKYLEKRFAR